MCCTADFWSTRCAAGLQDSWLAALGGGLAVRVGGTLYTSRTAFCLRCHTSTLSPNDAPGTLRTISAPEGRTILLDASCLHLPMRTYMSAFLHAFIRWLGLPQNLQRGALFCLVLGTVAWSSTVSWPEMIACKLALRALTACESVLILEVATFTGTG